MTSTSSDLAMEHLPCGRCGAEPGEPCRTTSGLRATYPHTSRTNPARALWWGGFEDATRDWTSDILHSAEGGDFSRLVASARREQSWMRQP